MLPTLLPGEVACKGAYFCQNALAGFAQKGIYNNNCLFALSWLLEKLFAKGHALAGALLPMGFLGAKGQDRNTSLAAAERIQKLSWAAGALERRMATMTMAWSGMAAASRCMASNSRATQCWGCPLPCKAWCRTVNRQRWGKGYRQVGVGVAYLSKVWGWEGPRMARNGVGAQLTTTKMYLMMTRGIVRIAALSM